MATHLAATLRAFKSYLSNQVGIPSPLFISHMVTLNCNMRCNYCTFWKEQQKEPELSTEEIFSFLDQCKDIGSVIYGITGGEPLLRKDVPEIMQYSKKIGLVNSLTTNGLLFEKRPPEILPYLDHVGISLDALDERHARIRGLKDKHLHEKIISTIKLASSQKNLRVDINTVINGANLDQIVPLINFAKENNCTLSCQPVIEGKTTLGSVSLRGKEKQFRETVNEVIKLKKAGYPILNSVEFMNIIRDRRVWDCRVARFMIELTPQGRIIFPCGGLCLPEGGIQEAVIESIREKPVKEIWFSKQADQLRENVRTCKNRDKCYLNCYVEMSLLLTKKSTALNYIRHIV